uniref:Truncated ribosomal protein L16 n=3 Tax=Cupressaceae TaxID=3367 RepID=D2DX86_9CONI|nr:truncated ribosomal protein L16 [Sequoia sempervirens]ACZ95584.1 truncated ribosomal protein L16 [Sequoiadendron giganteum]ACZ95599.1 truncated ribosomal protein L16 [Metasequoia glyptostroboides]
MGKPRVIHFAIKSITLMPRSLLVMES